jgi:hypothetical protein
VVAAPLDHRAAVIPPYGVRHRPVPVPPTWYAFRRRPHWRLALGGSARGRSRDGVCVDVERGLLGIRFGRWRMVTVLHNIAAVELAEAEPARPVRAVHRSCRDRYRRFGAPGAGAARVRFHRPVPPIHATGLHGRLATGVIVDVNEPDRLVEQLGSYRSSTSSSR